jgi:hypothetical protein
VGEARPFPKIATDHYRFALLFAGQTDKSNRIKPASILLAGFFASDWMILVQKTPGQEGPGVLKFLSE